MKKVIFLLVYFLAGWVFSLNANKYLITRIQSSDFLGKAFVFELVLIVFFFLFGTLLGSLLPFHIKLDRKRIGLLILPLLFLGLIPIMPWVIKVLAGDLFALGWTSAGDIGRSFSSSALTVTGIILASDKLNTDAQ